MKILNHKILALIFLITVNYSSAQESFILNYEDVDIKKVTHESPS